MSLFVINLILALVWVALTDSLNLSGILVGYAIGFGALWLAKPLYGDDGNYFVRLFRSLHLVLYFFYELVVSSLRVAWAVIVPSSVKHPAFLTMPLDVKSDLEIMLVANLISLTPGTLSIDVSEDRSSLLVHAMFAEDPEAEVKGLKDGMERMVARVFSNDS